MDIEKAFGEVLKIVRKKAGMSQEELAYNSSLDRTYISLLERGKRKPTINTVFSIAKALQILPNELIKMTEKILK